MRRDRGSLLVVLTLPLLALTTSAGLAQSRASASLNDGGPPFLAGNSPGAVSDSQLPLATAPSSMVVPAAYEPQLPGPLPNGGQTGQMYVPYGYAAPAAYMPMGTDYGYGQVYPAAYGGGYPAAGPQPLAPMPAEPFAAGYGASPGDYFDPNAADSSCPYCGGSGCEYCVSPGLLGGFLAGCRGRLLPYGEGGCCAPRWYDVTAEFMYLTRENVSRQIDFTADGILGDIVLSTENLDFDGEGGFRFTGAVQVWAGGNLEFTYFGLFNWASAAQVTSADDELFSVISDFGVNPLNGFDETDRARQHSIAYSSSLDNLELHFRKRWTGPNCRLQGSWLAGVRYIYLEEDFEYLTIGGDDDPVAPGLQSRGTMDYDVRTKNSLTGFQVGGDVWTCVIPGISLGGELKTGIYGNYAQQGTHIVATTTNVAQTATADETDKGSDAAFVSEGNLLLIYRLGPNWTFRAGYSLVYLNGVALAAENFNPEPAFSTSRVPAPVNDNGSLFYHGLTTGLEWMW